MSNTECSVEGCDRPFRTKGLCSMHAQRLARTGDPLGREGRTKKPCVIVGCDKEATAKGRCHNHYQQLLRGERVKENRPVKEKLPCSIEGCDTPRHGSLYCQAHYKRWKAYGDPLGSSSVKAGRQKGQTWSPEERAARAAARAERKAGTAKPREIVGDVRTECGHGHPFTPENTYVNARGRQECRTCHNVARVKHAYGLSTEQVEAMSDQQGAACAICRKPFTDAAPVIDHNHKTGAVRALLCGQCNSGLGMFKDNHALLSKAAEYLRNMADVEDDYVG